MISKDSLALAENIAVALPEGTVVPSTPILQGLNTLSYGAFPYEEDFRDKVVEVTSEITEHSAAIEAGSDKAAETIRGAFEMVKSYGVPMADAVQEKVGLLYSRGDLNWASLRHFNITYINVSDPFFDSAIYPTEVKNKALSFDSVGLDVLKRLEFEFATEQEIRDYVATSHPEINAILDSKLEDIVYAFYAITMLADLKSLFHYKGEATFDFTRVKSVRLNLLLKTYVILTKMYSQEDPAFLVKGSLEDYRAYINLLWNGMTHYLIALKNTVQLYRNRKAAIYEAEASKLVDFKPVDALDVTVKGLSGNVVVYYSDEVLKTVTGNGGSLNDCVIASIYGRLTGRPNGFLDLINNPDLVKDLTADYFEGIHRPLNQDARKHFINNSVGAIVQFLNEREEARAALYEHLDAEGSSVRTLIEENLSGDLDVLYTLYENDVCKNSGDEPVSMEIEAQRAKEVIFQTKLVPNFLKLLGCELAAEIIELTFVKLGEEDNLNSKRERLHGALIELLVGELLGV